jgi:hypothetical protein
MASSEYMPDEQTESAAAKLVKKEMRETGVEKRIMRLRTGKVEMFLEKLRKKTEAGRDLSMNA